LSNGTDTYRCFFCGVGTNAAAVGTAPTNYLGLDLDPTDGTVRLLARNAGVETLASTTSTITANTYTNNEFEVTWDGTTARAFKNGVQFTTLATGINTGFTADIYLGWVIKSVGTTDRQVGFFANAGINLL
jgi:hypothetical protein